MTVGTLATKDTRLFFAVSESAIHKVACATGISGLGGARDQIDITCLDSDEREYSGGFRNPGQLSVPINFIPRSASHQALLDLVEAGTTISWMIVFSDQTGSPTNVDSEGHLDSPGATTAEFMGYAADFAVDVATNEIVRGTLTVQRSGMVAWTKPTADLA